MIKEYNAWADVPSKLTECCVIRISSKYNTNQMCYWFAVPNFFHHNISINECERNDIKLLLLTPINLNDYHYRHFHDGKNDVISYEEFFSIAEKDHPEIMEWILWNNDLCVR